MRERNEREGDPRSTRELKAASYGSLKRLPALEVTTQPLSAKKQPYSSSGLLITWCGVVSLALFAASSFTAVSDSRLRGMKEVSSTPFKPVTHPLQPSKLLKNWEAPLPTGGWWTNAVLETPEGETGPIHPLPYAVKTAAAGLTVSYSVDRRNVGTTALSDVFATDIVFRASGSFTSRQVESSTPLSMTYSYSASRGSGGMMKAILLRGAPVITCEYSSLWPVLDASTGGIFSVVAGRGQADGRSLTSAAESSSCASNAACGSLGLMGNCCPTDEGVLLGCCSSSDSGSASSGDDTSGGNGGDDVPTTPSSFSHSFSHHHAPPLVHCRRGMPRRRPSCARGAYDARTTTIQVWLVSRVGGTRRGDQRVPGSRIHREFQYISILVRRVRTRNSESSVSVATRAP